MRNWVALQGISRTETTFLQVPGMILGSCNGLKTGHSSFPVFEGKRAGIDWRGNGRGDNPVEQSSDTPFPHSSFLLGWDKSHWKLVTKTNKIGWCLYLRKVGVPILRLINVLSVWNICIFCQGMFQSIFVDLLEHRNKVISIVSQLAACDQPSYLESSRQTGTCGILVGLFLLEQRTGDTFFFLECLPEQ